jgi:hypothetical protein
VLRVGKNLAYLGYEGIRVSGFVRSGSVAKGEGCRVVCMVMVVIKGMVVDNCVSVGWDHGGQVIVRVVC